MTYGVEFQKNLIVWKPSISMSNPSSAISTVSEELNSVETNPIWFPPSEVHTVSEELRAYPKNIKTKIPIVKRG